jgi:hypothetical protein
MSTTSNEMVGFYCSYISYIHKSVTKVYPGQPASHDEAKEIFAGFAGAFIDREAETRGLDFIDRERAKRDAFDQGADQLQQHGGW